MYNRKQLSIVLKKFFADKEKVYIAFFLVLLGLLSFFALGNLIISYKDGSTINNESAGDDHLESDLVASVEGKGLFLNLNGGFRFLFGQKEMNGIVRLNNGYLAEPLDEVSPEILSDNAQSVADLQKSLADMDIPFLYVLTPFKIQSGNSQLPAFVEDYSNESLDILVSELQQRNVEVLDLRTSFSADGVDHYSLFYRTDHHWNIDGGFYASSVISQRLEEILGVTVDPNILDVQNYHRVTYLAWHLGSYGQRTGTLFAGGADDFDLLLPNFETSVTNESNGVQGSFEEVMINDESLQNRALDSRYTYDNTLTLTHYCSNKASADKKILLLCDSMGKAVLPYLTLTFGDVKCLDAYTPSSLNQKVIQEYEPDIVIVMHFPLLITNTDSFQFGLGF